jgi:metallo-beta-lactamase family protein
MILESTYGDRNHPDTSPAEELVPLVKEIYKNRSVLLIPAFAVDRTQEVIYHLRNLFIQGEIPEVPIYIDSPMAIEVTKLFEDNMEVYDQDAIDVLLRKMEIPFSELRTYISQLHRKLQRTSTI